MFSDIFRLSFPRQPKNIIRVYSQGMLLRHTA